MRVLRWMLLARLAVELRRAVELRWVFACQLTVVRLAPELRPVLGCRPPLGVW